IILPHSSHPSSPLFPYTTLFLSLLRPRLRAKPRRYRNAGRRAGSASTIRGVREPLPFAEAVVAFRARWLDLAIPDSLATPANVRRPAQPALASGVDRFANPPPHKSPLAPRRAMARSAGCRKPPSKSRATPPGSDRPDLVLLSRANPAAEVRDWFAEGPHRVDREC